MKKDKDKFTINILLNGVRMPLIIPREDEVIYRNAEKLVNKQLEKYRKHYSQRSMEEILTMVAFQIAAIAAKQSLFNNEQPLVETIKELNEELKELI
ncbi:MAG: cell division protein ZapA [Porphyromonadaceae bacterium]|nr:cell division protein ZapA [Porphyromonadaceae bacterium]